MLTQQQEPSKAYVLAGIFTLSLREGGPAKPGRVWGGTRSDHVPPLIRRRGGTFPQGKVRTIPSKPLPAARSAPPKRHP